MKNEKSIKIDNDRKKKTYNSSTSLKSKLLIFNYQFAIRKSLGFSLIELIIVIAIMAILIAILAPMFLRYIERSRMSVDADAIGGMARTIRAVAVDTSLADVPPDTLTLTWNIDAAGTITVIAEDNSDTALSDKYQTAVREIVGTSISMRSQAAFAEGPVMIIIECVPGIIEIRLAAGEVSTLETEFSELLIGLH